MNSPTQPGPRLARALPLTLCLLLASCGGQQPDAALARYLERLERTLDQPAPAVELPDLPRMPPRGELRLDLERSNLGTLDFLALSGCEVQITIGKRNSSLGLLASPSQRLLLELEFLRLAPACIDHMRATERIHLAELLQDAHTLKQQQLPALIFNATLGGPEYRKLWQPPQRLGSYPAQTSSVPLTALAGINASARRWLAGDYAANNMEFEIQLSEVAKADGGALLKALALQAGWLEAGNALLRARRQRGPLCSGPIRPAAATTLRNVIGKFFVGEVQPWSAALGRRQHELLPLVAALESGLHSDLPGIYTRWQGRRDNRLQQWAGAPRRHVEELQAVLAPCEQD
ncbi:DUF3080 family protein [Haliea sp. E1-2-M8]|uniref:DUF3080 family protein n=1 Tax=Haliea sp. E1-2-M8 TaxID=3064706 RepID=UPI00271CE2AF|nr:DUF3080 family protein [Haliea sp. E1-2-M8]MDO8861834.1 DUF3080 family protein [Haliea sp. E1-2-M8]